MIRRVFWGWDRPVIDRAVELLTQDWQGGELDLADSLVIVPTAESGRRLREALAHAAARHSGAVSAPHVWAPEQALLNREDRAKAASRAQALLAWTKVMLDLKPEDHPDLFPVAPVNRGWAWASEMASAFAEMASTLGAGGYGFTDVANLEDLAVDRDRWRNLASLEAAYIERVRGFGREDVQSLKSERARNPDLPDGVQRIVVLPSPDLPVLFRRWLSAAATRVPVEVHILAPAGLAAQFDEFGSPLPSYWGERSPLKVPLGDEQIHLEHDPAEQARRALDLVREWVPKKRVALAVCDPEVAAHLGERLQHEEVRLYEPGGTPATRHGTVQMLGLWMELMETDGWQAFASLLRVPEVRDALSGKSGAAGMRVIAEADAFASERLAVTLEHALELIPAYVEAKAERGDATEVAESLQWAMLEAKNLVRGFQSDQPLHEGARALLIKLYGERSYQTENPLHRDQVALCTDWLKICEELHREGQKLQLGSRHLAGMSVEWLQSQKLSDPRGEVDMVLLGWLELLWEPALVLVIPGFNEEHVPGILVSHPFLPDQLRQALGVASQASRFARDSYLLSALAGQRRSAGSLHLICGLWSEGKDTLRPSRLLFLCDDASLPGRVRHLFPKDFESTLPKELPRERAWKLTPRPEPPKVLEKVSASRLSAYLRCPFTYYLDYVLGMGAVDPTKRELDAMEYGTLVHAALTALHTDEGKAAGQDEDALADLLVKAVERVAAKQHGKRLPVPVEVQLDSARQRLRAAAAIEAGLRREGWRTFHSEMELGAEGDPSPLVIGGARFTGRIDRVDRHPDGISRIIDYKTSDKAASPLAAHLKVLTKRTRVAPEDEWKTVIDSSGQTLMWQDLQLPLYVQAWNQRELGTTHAAYWSLPMVVEDAGLTVFVELDALLMDSALACAQEAVRRINAGIFWPPTKSARFDHYEGLIHGSVLDAVEWETLAGNA